MVWFVGRFANRPYGLDRGRGTGRDAAGVVSASDLCCEWQRGEV